MSHLQPSVSIRGQITCTHYQSSRRTSANYYRYNVYIWLRLFFAASLVSYNQFSIADNASALQQDKLFYQQLILIDQTSRNTGEMTLPQRKESFSNRQAAKPETINFNELWMQQHQPDYRYKDGGAAAGALLRMGAKAIYKSYYGGDNISVANSEDDFIGNQSNMDYRLRVSGDKIKLGIEYDF